MEFRYIIISDTEIEITGVVGNHKDLVIPAEINGLKVVNIGENAFSFSKIESVVLPNTLKRIESRSFMTNKIKELVIPDSVVYIGRSAFYYNELTTLVIPDSVLDIGDYAFKSNILSTVTLSKNISTIEESVFENNCLTTITIPDLVTAIYTDAFRYNAIENISIPKSTIYIGDSSFGNGVQITKGDSTIVMIDSIATIIKSTKTVGDFTIYEAETFNFKNKCFVAQKGEYYAHGENIKQAVSNVNFKHLQDNVVINDLVKQIKQKQTITVEEFRLITGACSLGCKEFMQRNNLYGSEYPLQEALKLIKNQYGWGKIQEHFNK